MTTILIARCPLMSLSGYDFGSDVASWPLFVNVVCVKADLHLMAYGKLQCKCSFAITWQTRLHLKNNENDCLSVWWKVLQWWDVPTYTMNVISVDPILILLFLYIMSCNFCLASRCQSQFWIKSLRIKNKMNFRYINNILFKILFLHSSFRSNKFQRCGLSLHLLAHFISIYLDVIL